MSDYFQVAALSQQIRREDWDSHPCRVERNVDRILGLFSESGVSATFFTLGWIAERYPRVVRQIVDGGHELASHGYEHIKVHSQEPDAFRHDIRWTKAILADIGGQRVTGYRAARFSIHSRTLRTFDCPAAESYAYSPTHTPPHPNPHP